MLHQQRAAEAAYDLAAAQYRSTVLGGVPERRRRAARAADPTPTRCKRAARRAMRAASDRLDLAQDQYRLGAIAYLTLLNAERTYQQARIALVQAQAARLRRHRGAVPGAGRRLVESQRRWRPIRSARIAGDDALAPATTEVK